MDIEQFLNSKTKRSDAQKEIAAKNRKLAKDRLAASRFNHSKYRNYSNKRVDSWGVTDFIGYYIEVAKRELSTYPDIMRYEEDGWIFGMMKKAIKEFNDKSLLKEYIDFCFPHLRFNSTYRYIFNFEVNAAVLAAFKKHRRMK